MYNTRSGGENSYEEKLRKVRVYWGHDFRQCDQKVLFEWLTNDHLSEYSQLECFPTRENKCKDPEDLEELSGASEAEEE